mmetsp:Transcript_5875/g.18018  ORF Transcript_5875/g.18018 Transcript_5875/m.18018 type:complete len:270 (+) Transcript_5875:1201-2010(+)
MKKASCSPIAASPQHHSRSVQSDPHVARIWPTGANAMPVTSLDGGGSTSGRCATPAARSHTARVTPSSTTASSWPSGENSINAPALDPEVPASVIGAPPGCVSTASAAPSAMRLSRTARSPLPVARMASSGPTATANTGAVGTGPGTMRTSAPLDASHTRVEPSLLQARTSLPLGTTSTALSPLLSTPTSLRLTSSRVRPAGTSTSSTVESKSSSAATEQLPSNAMCFTREPCCGGSSFVSSPVHVSHTQMRRSAEPVTATVPLRAAIR